MTVKGIVQSNNTLASSPHYADILAEYNRRYTTFGKVNASKFHREVILPLLPNYSLNTWQQFHRRLRYNGAHTIGLNVGKKADQAIEEARMHENLASDREATQIGINAALNLGSKMVTRLLEKYDNDPDSLSETEKKLAIDFLFKAMKAQDSRVGAIGKIKEDKRQEDVFNRIFNKAAYK